MNDETTPPNQSPHGGALAVVSQHWENLVAAIVATTPLSREDAEDLLGDFTVELLDGGINAAPESWLHYLKRALRNRALNKARDDGRAERRVYDGPSADWMLPNRNHVLEGVAGWIAFTDALTDLRRLPETEREVFWLRYWDDLMPVQIAAHTGLTTRQVDERLRQAKQRLAKMRAERDGTPNYALLALILHPVTRHDTSTALGSTFGTCVVSFTAAVALSLVTVVSGGAPAPFRGVTATAPDRATSPPPGSRAPSRPGPPHGRLVGVPPLPDADPAGPARRAHLTPTVALPTTCTQQLCVTPRSGEASGPGDTVTVNVLGERYRARESVVPICEYVVPNPFVECERQEPANWVVKDVPPPPVDGGIP